MKKIMIIILTVFLNSFLTSCSANDDELVMERLEDVQSTGGDDEDGEILPPPPPPKPKPNSN